ncbi:MAG: 3-hydroxyacyl-CoA dehydrogenase family protein [Candidatus Thorarchaeota archaeon]
MNDSFTKVAIIGSGTMGSGIAIVFASAGIDVNLVDVEKRFLDKGMERINKSLDISVKREKITKDERDSILRRIKLELDLEEATKEIQLIVEAIIEEEESKKDLFKQLDLLCTDDVIFASNTSAINITSLSSVTKRSDKFIGLHFFNPPTIMKLVEVIIGSNTAEYTVEKIINLCKRLGKEPVPSNEAPGFIVNRILWQFLNESYKLLEFGVAEKENIDKAVKLGLNHPMGPLELSDYIGLDVMLHIGEYLASQLGDSYKPALILQKLVKEGKLGKKTGKGFYDYTK